VGSSTGDFLVEEEEEDIDDLLLIDKRLAKSTRA